MKLLNFAQVKAGMAVLAARTHSPAILFGAGVVGVVGTVVLASRATLKLEDVLAEAQSDFELVEKADVDEQDRLQAKVGVVINTGVKLVKLYGPTVALGVASIGALAGSHHILSRRNAALAAALTAVQKSFRAYRDRVIEDLGEEKDRKYRYGLEKTQVTEVDENGKKTTATKVVSTGNGASPYGKIFREGNPNWNPNTEYNLIFIKMQQNYLNDRLRVKGWITLNDAYDQLGFERTKAGCVVGWRLHGNGDGVVDLGVYDPQDPTRFFDYVRGAEDELYLDFNVDGNIFEKLED